MAIYPVKHVSWNEVAEWSKRLAMNIAMGFKPDIIVAVGRGGYVVSRLLCDFLDVDKLIALPIRWKEKVKKYGENYLASLIRCFARGDNIENCIASVVNNLEVEIALNIDVDLRGLRALAVEEISATGLHLAKAKEIILNNWRAREVKSASLVWKSTTSILRPDYILIETPSFVWFQFPWSRTSDYQQMAKVALEEECINVGKCLWSLDEIIELFKKWYNFKPDIDYLTLSLNKLVNIGVLERIDRTLFKLKDDAI